MMRISTRNIGWWIRRITATELVLLLLLVGLSGCAARHLPDWSWVQDVPPDTKTEVQLYKDKAIHGVQKFKGRFIAATNNSVTLNLKNGQDKIFQRESVRRVRIPRPNKWAKWVALGTPPAIVGALAATGSPTNIIPAFFGIPVFLIPDMKPIYEVPPDHR